MARLVYSSNQGERAWRPWWAIDYPEAELHLTNGLRRLTALDVAGDSRHLTLMDEEIFDYPWLFAQQAGDDGKKAGGDVPTGSAHADPTELLGVAHAGNSGDERSKDQRDHDQAGENRRSREHPADARIEHTQERFRVEPAKSDGKEIRQDLQEPATVGPKRLGHAGVYVHDDGRGRSRLGAALVHPYIGLVEHILNIE